MEHGFAQLGRSVMEAYHSAAQRYLYAIGLINLWRYYLAKLRGEGRVMP